MFSFRVFLGPSLFISQHRLKRPPRCGRLSVLFLLLDLVVAAAVVVRGRRRRRRRVGSAVAHHAHEAVSVLTLKREIVS